MSGGPIGPTDRDGMRIVKGDTVQQVDPSTGATLRRGVVTWAGTGQPWKVDVRWEAIEETVSADSIIVVPRGSK